MDNLREHLAEGERAGRRYALGLPRQTPRGASGAALGQRAGSSLEFKDYRDYQFGDDLRHIDWNAYARNDQLSVKLYREEITPHVDVVLDASRSMDLDDSAKARAAVALTALLVTAASNAGFGHAVWIMNDELRPIPNGDAQPSSWGEWNLEHRGNPSNLLARGTPTWRPRGVRVLVSDLLWEGEPMLAVKGFCDGASSAAVIQLLAAADVDPPEDGALRLVDMETDQVREIDMDAEVAQRYRDALARHQQNWHEACRRSGAIFTTVVAETLLRDWRLDDLVASEFLKIV